MDKRPFPDLNRGMTDLQSVATLKKTTRIAEKNCASKIPLVGLLVEARRKTPI